MYKSLIILLMSLLFVGCGGSDDKAPLVAVESCQGLECLSLSCASAGGELDEQSLTCQCSSSKQKYIGGELNQCVDLKDITVSCSSADGVDLCGVNYQNYSFLIEVDQMSKAKSILSELVVQRDLPLVDVREQRVQYGFYTDDISTHVGKIPSLSEVETKATFRLTALSDNIITLYEPVYYAFDLTHFIQDYFAGVDFSSLSNLRQKRDLEFKYQKASMAYHYGTYIGSMLKELPELASFTSQSSNVEQAAQVLDNEDCSKSCSVLRVFNLGVTDQIQQVLTLIESGQIVGHKIWSHGPSDESYALTFLGPKYELSHVLDYRNGEVVLFKNNLTGKVIKGESHE